MKPVRGIFVVACCALAAVLNTTQGVAFASSPISVSVQPDPAQGHDLKLVLTNRGARTVTAKATIDLIGSRTDSFNTITLSPHETLSLNITNAQPADAPLTEPLPVALSLTSPAGDASWAGNVYFWAARPTEPGPRLILDSAQQWQDQDGAWTGTADLRATITARYDKQRLYLYADVEDDVFSQTGAMWDIWRGDSVQIAVDPQWKRQPNAANTVEIGMALTPVGPQVYRWTGKMGLVPGAALKVSRNGSLTRYDASIPWRELGITTVAPPQTIGLSVLVNDNDGKGRDGWMAYGDGIAASKRADRFACLTLLP